MGGVVQRGRVEGLQDGLDYKRLWFFQHWFDNTFLIYLAVEIVGEQVTYTSEASCSLIIDIEDMQCGFDTYDGSWTQGVLYFPRRD